MRRLAHINHQDKKSREKEVPRLVQKIQKYMPLGSTLLALAALVLCSAQAMESARYGLMLCAQMIVPSLLPFFILSSLLRQLGLPGVLGRLLAPVTERLFGIGGAGASAFLLGVTGGYPLGAATVAQLYRDGSLTRDEAERALAFCNNSGPAFLIGAAGTGIFHSAGIGLLLYGVHVLAAVLVGMLFAPRRRRKASAERTQIAVVSFAVALPEAVRASVQTLLTVCGFVVTFSVVTGMLDAAGIFPALAGALAGEFGLELHFTRALLTGLLEIGTGLGAMQGLAATPQNLALCAFLIGWGGVSVHCQTAAVLAGTTLKSARHTAGRFLHGVLSALLIIVFT